MQVSSINRSHDEYTVIVCHRLSNEEAPKCFSVIERRKDNGRKIVINPGDTIFESPNGILWSPRDWAHLIIREEEGVVSPHKGNFYDIEIFLWDSTQSTDSIPEPSQIAYSEPQEVKFTGGFRLGPVNINLNFFCSRGQETPKPAEKAPEPETESKAPTIEVREPGDSQNNPKRSYLREDEKAYRSPYGLSVIADEPYDDGWICGALGFNSKLVLAGPIHSCSKEDQEFWKKGYKAGCDFRQRHVDDAEKRVLILGHMLNPSKYRYSLEPIIVEKQK